MRGRYDDDQVGFAVESEHIFLPEVRVSQRNTMRGSLHLLAIFGISTGIRVE